jgi:hypothetical protein
MAAVAADGLEAGRDDRDFLESKLATARFFHQRLLPLSTTLLARIESGSAPLDVADALL